MLRKDINSLFWIAFWSALAFMLMLGGCTTERGVVRYVERHPAVLDNWITRDTILEIKIDTLYFPDSIPFALPAERIVDSFFIESPCPDAEPINFGPEVIENSFARATFEIRDGILFTGLEMKDTTIYVKYDSARSEINRLEHELIKEIARPPPEKKIPWWAWVTLIISIFATVLLVLTLLLRK